MRDTKLLNVGTRFRPMRTGLGAFCSPVGYDCDDRRLGSKAGARICIS